MITAVKKANPHFSNLELCRAFSMSSSCFYYQPAPQSAEKATLVDKVVDIFTESLETYGKRRIRVELAKSGTKVGLYAVASMMKKRHLTAIRPKKKHYYPDAGEEHRFADNVLKRQFNPATHNSHWVGDITYIRTHQGWSYLACVLDLGTKEIVGYALSSKANAKLAVEALDNAIARQRPDLSKLMFHSDQGCQYSATEFRSKLNTLKVTQSMSRRGNCWDNAVMERFFRSLKTERLNRVTFMNHESVVAAVASYVQFYNYKRLHSSLDYMTPHEKYIERKQAA